MPTIDIILLFTVALACIAGCTGGEDTATGTCPLLDTLDAEPFANGRVSAHAWSPDSECLAVVQCPEGRTWGCDLRVVDRDLDTSYRVASDASPIALGGWQDGWIYYHRYSVEGLPSTYTGDAEFWRIRPDGTGWMQVTDTLANGIKTEHNPVYDDIGTAVAGAPVPGTPYLYFEAHNGNGWYATFRCPLDGCDEPSEVVEISSRWAWTIGPSQGPGPLLFTRGSDWDSDMTLFAASLEGDDRVPLVADLQRQARYTGSPDQSKVAWSDQYGARELRVVNTDGTEDRALFPAGANDLLTDFFDDGSVRGSTTNARVWSPDSTQVLFGSDRVTPFHVFRAAVDGTELVQVTRDEAIHWAPSYSPDGAWISFYRLPSEYDPSVWPFDAELVVVPDP